MVFLIAYNFVGNGVVCKATQAVKFLVESGEYDYEEDITKPVNDYLVRYKLEVEEAYQLLNHELSMLGNHHGGNVYDTIKEPHRFVSIKDVHDHLNSYKLDNDFIFTVIDYTQYQGHLANTIA